MPSFNRAVVRDAPAPSSILSSRILARFPDVDVVRSAPSRAASSPERPCLFVIDADAPAPRDWSTLDDWVRLPVDDGDLIARLRTLRARAAHPGA